MSEVKEESTLTIKFGRVLTDKEKREFEESIYVELNDMPNCSWDTEWDEVEC